eukprot:4094171-Amphidinium_carterae.1
MARRTWPGTVQKDVTQSSMFGLVSSCTINLAMGGFTSLSRLQSDLWPLLEAWQVEETSRPAKYARRQLDSQPKCSR